MRLTGCYLNALKSLALAGLLFLFPIVKAQDSDNLPHYKEILTRADENFNLVNYKEAILLYKEVLEKLPGDTSVICKIANSYRLYNKPKEAEEWYKMAVLANENTIAKQYYFQLAQVLTNNSKYREALYWYKKYNEAVPTDIRAIEAVKSLENISGLYRDSIFFSVYPLPVNSKYTDLGPRYFKDGLIFLTDRDDQKLGTISMYISVKDSSGNFSQPARFISGVKAQFNEGSVAFFDNNRQVIFSQNYLDTIHRKKTWTVPFKLFSANCDSILWDNVHMLPFQGKDYSYSQPSISEDGEKLFFSSDMPNGFGGSDIYMVSKEKGKWGTPVNLGFPVNTAGDETFPFIFRDSVLYFSSNGHGGLGEQDVFRIYLNDSNSLKNMGSPINSSFDDFGITFSKDGLSGYFASNRNNDISGDDIFGFKQIRMSVKLKIVDEVTGQPVSFANVHYGDTISGTTDMDGSLEIIVPVNGESQLSVNKEFYETKNVTINSTQLREQPQAVLPIKIKDLPLDEILVLTDLNGNPLNSKDVVYKVQVMASRRLATHRELRKKYKGKLSVHKSFEDNWYKYTIGEYKTYAEAKAVKQGCNVCDSFVVAYIDHQRVNIKIAKETSKSCIQVPVSN